MATDENITDLKCAEEIIKVANIFRDIPREKYWKDIANSKYEFFWAEVQIVKPRYQWSDFRSHIHDCMTLGFDSAGKLVGYSQLWGYLCDLSKAGYLPPKNFHSIVFDIPDKNHHKIEIPPTEIKSPEDMLYLMKDTYSDAATPPRERKLSDVKSILELWLQDPSKRIKIGFSELHEIDLIGFPSHTIRL